MFAELLETSVIVSVLAATVRIATPILLAALGEMVAERSGVYNMGLEGTMLMGAFTAYLAAYYSTTGRTQRCPSHPYTRFLGRPDQEGEKSKNYLEQSRW